jgi:hypothetical protein
MADDTLPLAAPAAPPLREQDRGGRPWTRIATTALSLLVIAAALYQARGVHFADVRALVTPSPLFWMTFVAAYLCTPVSEWIIYRRLWGIGPEAIAPLLRKQVYNELLLGYLGEAYFYNWARNDLKLATTPFGAVKDVAVMSAIAGNAMTVMLVALAAPFAGLLDLGHHAGQFGWSLAIVMVTSTALLLFRGRIFSLEGADLRFVFGVHIGRILAAAGLGALMWHLVLPQIPLAWWLVLVAVRMLISRLPLVPNKDVVFAGIAVFAIGRDLQIGELLTLMAALILTLHIVVGTTFAIGDLVRKTDVAPG